MQHNLKGIGFSNGAGEITFQVQTDGDVTYKSSNINIRNLQEHTVGVFIDALFNNLGRFNKGSAD